MTVGDEQDVLVTLEGLSFPAGKDDLLVHATDRGGVEAHVIAVLDQLPDRTFGGPTDVLVSLAAGASARPPQP